MIRTAGEHRISNFILWELACTDLYVSEVLWPDFRRRDLAQFIEMHTARKVRDEDL
jgi:undecaprenyl diphosphate synthase